MTSTHTHNCLRRRRSGCLLHPTSLPGGGLGTDAVRFIDFLAGAGFSVWQMLPVNNTDKYGCPYQGTSVHAGNPRFIDLMPLSQKEWLNVNRLNNRSNNLAAVSALIAEARHGFIRRATDVELGDYQAFKQTHIHWLDDYALFSAIKQEHQGKPWWKWPQRLRMRDKTALKSFSEEHSEQIENYCFEQFLFFSQWQELRKLAHDRGILLFGDVPIFTAHDSVDVWAYPDYFQLDEAGQPTVVAGVPPDYFSPTGQRWGNPVYNWPHLAKDGFRWWVERLRTQLELFDLVRLDHFRGFVALWEIPAHCPTAEEGTWQPAPGRELFKIFHKEFGDLPLIAEDLGIISEEVVKLADDFMLPGIKVLQFAFDNSAGNPYLPHNHNLNSVVYTGTHDNNTTLGWFCNLDDTKQQHVLEYLQYPNETMPWPLINSALQSVCPLAIVPMQDLLGLDASHRMNTPGTMAGNWRWRFDWEWITSDLIKKLWHLNALYGRL
ncbi:MAG: 4-alpha-glucanotransferase [Gammaproteobacteria bacterium]